MLALYRSGRQAEALRVGTELRRRLDAELGVDPSPDLRALETAILKQDSRLQLPDRDAERATVSIKYRPPTSARRLVSRGRLIEKLRGSGGRRLVMIRGPAGSGKTTLAAQWRTVLADEGTAVAWLTVDEDDNNVVWFVTDLIEAVRTVRPTLARQLRQVLEERGPTVIRRVLTSFIDQIDDDGASVVIVIDDWHRITEATTIEALTYLLDHCGAHTQVIVTSRTRSNLPVSRMRARDELVEIDSQDMRFDTSESRAFLLGTCGLALDDTHVASLERTTDGWVVGLQLASLSLRVCRDPGMVISRMSGRDHAIGEYLAENVLDSLQPELRDFLMATSITERISGDLASTLAGTAHGQGLLEEAENRDLFLRRLDPDGEWFRYHQLFAEYLRRRLERDHPDRVAPLHAAASRWFAEQGLQREAVDHAIAADDADRAVELIELFGVDLIRTAKVSTFRGLVSKLPAHIIAHRPRLQLAVGWASAMLQQPEGARSALEAFETAVSACGLPEADLHGARLEADVLRAMLDSWADRTAGVEELLSECLSSPEAAPPFLVSVAANVAAFMALWRFDFDAVRGWQQWAAPYQDRDNPFSRIYGLCLSGMAAREQLDDAGAERCLREALQLAESYGGIRHSDAELLAGALLGELLFERGEVDEAERLLDDSYEFGSSGGTVEFLILRHVVSARVKAARGDRDTAAVRLNEGARVAVALGLPRLRSHVDNELTRMGLPIVGRRGRVDQEALPHGGLGEATAQIRDEAVIRGLSAEQPDLACQLAREWVERLVPQGRPRALLQAKRLLAEAMAAAGRSDDTGQALVTGAPA
ncbi:hypothetical protein BHQ18_12100 [Mycolicibacterium flavescens]|uniref:Uncharacterized protein n=2 Tax=Mycolicibacterium flavescens TaxID=1776 RepID=A0A1E3RK07_MYCFV|nr:hypothetical protein BHQ18_12100 [Mycolicibacterium flavescens]